MNCFWISLMLFPALLCYGSYIPECAKGKKWHANNTDYEVYENDKGLILVSKCTLPGYYHQGVTWIPCIRGKYQGPLPQCRKEGYVERRAHEVSCKELPIPSAGYKSCDAKAPAVGSRCDFTCEDTHYLKGSRRRYCSEDGKWTGNEVSCLPRSVCPVPPPLHNGTVIGCSDRNIPKFGSICGFKCNEGFILVGPEELHCRSNKKLTDDVGAELYPKCIGLRDPCAYRNCSHYCRDHVGLAKCFCHDGYKLHENGMQCIDIDECIEGKHRCHPNTTVCQNIVGSYKCRCRIGYKRENGFNCKKIDASYSISHIGQERPRQNSQSRSTPCKISNGGCEHICDYSSGFVKCRCKEGYDLSTDRKTCKILQPYYETRGIEQNNHVSITRKSHVSSVENACRIENGGCEHRCEETAGVANCSCHAGFKLKIDGKKCQRSTNIPDSNLHTCAFNNGGCSESCNDETGTVRCSCKQGYKLLPDHRTCVDIDECQENNGGCSHDCINFKGTHYCSCPIGSQLRADRKSCYVSHLQTCVYDNGGCSQSCKDDTGTVICSCKHGYKLLPDKRTCVDVDECLSDNFKCSDTCVNLQGSARCTCKRGFKLMKDGKQCADIDECAAEALNDCDQKCHNTNGSYTCSCDAGYVPITDFKCEGCRINSYRSSSDTFCIDCPPNSHTDSGGKASLVDCLCNDGFYGNITENEPCRDIDECSYANFGCSNICVNTPGSAHCACPQGFELQEDQKTCSDTDECKLKNGGCQGNCHNSVGSFRCSCPEGYTISTSDSYVCDDIDECQDNNGGCSHDCINFQGGHHCSCPVGSQLRADGKSCHTLYCPGVAVPYFSSLRCSLKGNKTAKANYTGGQISMEFPVGTYCWLKCNKGYALEESSKTIECQSNGMWNKTLEECKVLQCPALEVPKNGDLDPPECKKGLRTVNERCYFTCNEGFLMEGKPVVTCQNKLQWNYDSIPTCLPKQITPIITCPNDIRVDLMPNESSANITIPSPVSNMEHLQVDPDWAKLERPVTFPAGQTNIVFTAKNPYFGNMSSSCTMSVSVVDTESPNFLHCPSTITISGNEIDGTREYWTEPEAVDNVGIKSIIKSAEPNSNWPPGIHTVDYIAEDLAGNTAKCSFEINVTSNECEDLADPENGEANCMDWVYGKLCEPSCNENYTKSHNESQFYVCDDTGMWSPSNVVPDCLPECGLEEVWSENLQQCVTTTFDLTDVDSE